MPNGRTDSVSLSSRSQQYHNHTNGTNDYLRQSGYPEINTSLSSPPTSKPRHKRTGSFASYIAACLCLKPVMSTETTSSIPVIARQSRRNQPRPRNSSSPYADRPDVQAILSLHKRSSSAPIDIDELPQLDQLITQLEQDPSWDMETEIELILSRAERNSYLNHRLSQLVHRSSRTSLKSSKSIPSEYPNLNDSIALHDRVEMLKAQADLDPIQLKIQKVGDLADVCLGLVRDGAPVAARQLLAAAAAAKNNTKAGEKLKSSPVDGKYNGEASAQNGQDTDDDEDAVFVDAEDGQDAMFEVARPPQPVKTKPSSKPTSRSQSPHGRQPQNRGHTKGSSASSMIEIYMPGSPLRGTFQVPARVSPRSNSESSRGRPTTLPSLPAVKNLQKEAKEEKRNSQVWREQLLSESLLFSINSGSLGAGSPSSPKSAGFDDAKKPKKSNKAGLLRLKTRQKSSSLSSHFTSPLTPSSIHSEPEQPTHPTRIIANRPIVDKKKLVLLVDSIAPPEFDEHGRMRQRDDDELAAIVDQFKRSHHRGRSSKSRHNADDEKRSRSLPAREQSDWKGAPENATVPSLPVPMPVLPPAPGPGPVSPKQQTQQPQPEPSRQSQMLTVPVIEPTRRSLNLNQGRSHPNMSTESLRTSFAVAQQYVGEEEMFARMLEEEVARDLEEKERGRKKLAAKKKRRSLIPGRSTSPNIVTSPTSLSPTESNAASNLNMYASRRITPASYFSTTATVVPVPISKTNASNSGSLRSYNSMSVLEGAERPSRPVSSISTFSSPNYATDMRQEPERRISGKGKARSPWRRGPEEEGGMERWAAMIGERILRANKRNTVTKAASYEDIGSHVGGSSLMLPFTRQSRSIDIRLSPSEEAQNSNEPSDTKPTTASTSVQPIETNIDEAVDPNSIPLSPRSSTSSLISYTETNFSRAEDDNDDNDYDDEDQASVVNSGVPEDESEARLRKMRDFESLLAGQSNDKTSVLKPGRKRVTGGWVNNEGDVLRISLTPKLLRG